MTSKIGTTLMTLGGPAIAAANRALPTIIRGTARAMEVAQRVVASGGEILAWESPVMMRASQAGMQVIGRFKLDMIVRLPGKAINTLIESKGVPWDLYTRHPAGWQNVLNSLGRQSNAFGQAAQSQSGVVIEERMIYFTSRIPQGLEAAAAEVEAALANNYQAVLWG
ncbi:MAG: hypothetical protein HS113_06985 [Verrucomicrobiales bacterium]|nr:hypothetical protein [Verrucomicrobiales bacterium]